MLQGIRTATKSWLGYAVLFIMTLFLVAAFALWGVGDIFRGGVDTTVATVGERTVDRATFETEMKSQLRALSNQRGTEITVEEARAMGLHKMILDRMIERIAMDERVAVLGLMATDDTVRNVIQKDQTFESGAGTFDRDKFLRLLSQAGFSENQYIDSVRADLMRQQYRLALVAGLVTPPRLGRLVYDYVNEKRTVEYIPVTAADAGAPPEPTGTELADFHKARGTMFSTPEYREVEYVQVGVNEVAGEIRVTEADVQAAWEKRKKEFQVLEKRDVDQIAFPDQAAAQAAYNRIQSGTPFLTVANEAGKSEAEVKLGTYDRETLDPRLAGAVFALPLNGVSAPVQGPFNWVILRVTRIVPGKEKTYEQVRDQLRADLMRDKSEGPVSTRMGALDDALAAGKPLAQAAAAARLAAKRVTIDSKGLSPDGTKAAIASSPIFLQQVFASDIGTETDPFTGEDQTQYVLRVVAVRPAAPKPLETVRAQVREAWLADKRGKLLLQRVQALAAQAQTDRSLAGVGRTLGRAPSVSPELTRGAQGTVFAADALAKIFSSPAGTAVFGRAAASGGGGYVLARVTKVTHPDPRADELMAFRNEVGTQLGRDAEQAATLLARKLAGVEINRRNLEAAPTDVQ